MVIFPHSTEQYLFLLKIFCITTVFYIVMEINNILLPFFPYEQQPIHETSQLKQDFRQFI